MQNISLGNKPLPKSSFKSCVYGFTGILSSVRTGTQTPSFTPCFSSTTILNDMVFHSSCHFLWDCLARVQISSARRRPSIFIVFPLGWGWYCDKRGSLISFSRMMQAVNIAVISEQKLLVIMLLYFSPLIKFCFIFTLFWLIWWFVIRQKKESPQ